MFTSLALVLLAASPANVQDQATFARVDKAGEKSVYAMTWTNGAFKTTIEADMEITVLKVLESGRADLRLKASEGTMKMTSSPGTLKFVRKS